MTEILTGKQLRDRAEACLDQRRPDKETLRNWIRRGADRIDKLGKEVQRLEQALESGGSEAALMMLEDARVAADNTLDRVKGMEEEAEKALNKARSEADKVKNDIIGTAHAEAAEIIASGRETAKEHMAKTEAVCQNRLDKAVAQAERVDRGCRQLVDRAQNLERTYRKRVADIRAEAKAMVGLMDRFDTLAVAMDEDDLSSEDTVDELLAEIVELNVRGEDGEGDAGDEDEVEAVEEVEEVG
ncbi:MAG: hypothetical protein AAF480_19105 [Actinomycetota bacterium]